MKEILLCKYGEIVLKGANRSMFESTLLKELRYRASTFGKFRITHAQSAAYIEPLDEFADMEGLFGAVGRLFGFAAVGRAAETEKRMESILETVKTYLPSRLGGAKTFKFEAKRADKTFPLPSPEIAAAAGGALLSVCPHLRVDVNHPDVTFLVKAYVSTYGVNAEEDMLLSLERAKTVKQFFVDHGIAADRMTTAGMTRNEIKRAAAAALDTKSTFSNIKVELIITGKTNDQ